MTEVEFVLAILLVISLLGGFCLWIFKIGKAKGNKDKDDELNKSSISSIQKTIRKHDDRISALESGTKIDQGSILTEIKKVLKAAQEGTKRHES